MIQYDKTVIIKGRSTVFRDNQSSKETNMAEFKDLTNKLQKNIKASVEDVSESFSDIGEAVHKKDYNSVKDIIVKNRHKIAPFVSLIRNCVRDAANMRETPNIMDYMDLVFSWKENYDEAIGPQTPSSYFDNDDWQPFFNFAFHEFLIKLISHSYPKSIRMVKSVGTASAHIAEINGFKFGWAVSGERIDYFCIEKGKSDQAFKLIEEMFWRGHPSGQVIVGVEKDELSIKEDLSHKEFIKFKKCTELAEYIQQFYQQGVSRSILFYGPPGSGKSNLVKGISFCLNSKTIRFTSLENLNNSFVAEILRALNPDSVILEDIDHNSNDDINDLLDKLEDFNNQKKLIFATANEVSKLDNALLRPGRFDEVIEINKLDEEVLRALVKDDPELFEITRTFPVAFTVELLKRVKVLGKEKALANMDDIAARIENLEQVNYELRTDHYSPKLGGKLALLKSKKSLKVEDDE